MTRKRVDSVLATFEAKNEENRASNDRLSSPPRGGGRRPSPVKSRSSQRKSSNPMWSSASSLQFLDEEERKRIKSSSRKGLSASSASLNMDSLSPSALTGSSPQSTHSTSRRRKLGKGSNKVVSAISNPPLDANSNSVSPTSKRRDQVAPGNTSPKGTSHPKSFRGTENSEASAAVTGSSYAPPWLSSHASPDDETDSAMSPSASLTDKLFQVKANNNSPGGTIETQPITSASEASSSVSSLKKKFSSPRRARSTEHDLSGGRPRHRGKSLERSKSKRSVKDDRHNSFSSRSARSSYLMPSEVGEGKVLAAEQQRLSSSMRSFSSEKWDGENSTSSLASSNSVVKSPSRRKRRSLKIGSDQIKKLVGDFDGDLKRGHSSQSVGESSSRSVKKSSSSERSERTALSSTSNTPDAGTDTGTAARVSRQKLSRKQPSDGRLTVNEGGGASKDRLARLVRTISTPSVVNNNNNNNNNNNDRRSSLTTTTASSSYNNDDSQRSTRSLSSRRLSYTENTGKEDDVIATATTPKQRRRFSEKSAVAWSVSVGGSRRSLEGPVVVVAAASQQGPKRDGMTPELRRHLSSRSIGSVHSEGSSVSSKSRSSRSVRDEPKSPSKRKGSISSLRAAVDASDDNSSASSKGETSNNNVESSVPRRRHILRNSSAHGLDPLQETGESGDESDTIATSEYHKTAAAATGNPHQHDHSDRALVVSAVNHSPQRKRRSMDGSITKRDGRDCDMEAEMKAFNKFRQGSFASGEESPSPQKEKSKSSSSRKKDSLPKTAVDPKPMEDSMVNNPSPYSTTTTSSPRRRKKRTTEITPGSVNSTDSVDGSVQHQSIKSDDSASVRSQPSLVEVGVKSSIATPSDDSSSVKSHRSLAYEQNPESATAVLSYDASSVRSGQSIVEVHQKPKSTTVPTEDPPAESEDDESVTTFTTYSTVSTYQSDLGPRHVEAVGNMRLSGMERVSSDSDHMSGAYQVPYGYQPTRSNSTSDQNSEKGRPGISRQPSRSGRSLKPATGQVDGDESVTDERSVTRSSSSRGVARKVIKTKLRKSSSGALVPVSPKKTPKIRSTQQLLAGKVASSDGKAISPAEKFGIQLSPTKLTRSNSRVKLVRDSSDSAAFDMVKSRIESNDSLWSSTSFNTKTKMKRRLSNPRPEALAKTKMVSPHDLNVKKTEILARGIRRRLSNGGDQEIPRVRRPSMGHKKYIPTPKEAEPETAGRVLSHVQKYETLWKRTNVTIDESAFTSPKPPTPGRKVIYKLETRGPGKRRVWRRTSCSGSAAIDAPSRGIRRVASLSKLAETKLDPSFVSKHKSILESHRRMAACRIQGLFRGCLQRLHNKRAKDKSSEQLTLLSTSSHHRREQQSRDRRAMLRRTMSYRRSTTIRADFVRQHTPLKLIHEDKEATRIQAMVRGKMQRLRYRVMYLENKLKTINKDKKTEVASIQHDTAKAIRKLERKRAKQLKKEEKERALIVERAELARKLSEQLIRDNKKIKEQNDRLQYFIDHLKDVNAQYEKRIAAHLKNCVTMSMHVKKMQAKRDNLVSKNERFKAHLTKLKGNLLTGLHLTNWETRHATNFERVSREIIETMEKRSSDHKLVETLKRIKAGTYNEEEEQAEEDALYEEVTEVEEEAIEEEAIQPCATEPSADEAVVVDPSADERGVVEQEHELVDGERTEHEEDIASKNVLEEAGAVIDEMEVEEVGEVEEEEEEEEEEAEAGNTEEEGFLLTLCADDVSEASDISDVSALNDSFNGGLNISDYIDEIEEDEELFKKSKALLEERYLEDEKPKPRPSSDPEQRNTRSIEGTRLLGQNGDEEDNEDGTLVEVVDEDGNVLHQEKQQSEKGNTNMDDEEYDDFEYEEIIVEDDDDDDDDGDDTGYDDQSSIYVARSILM